MKKSILSAVAAVSATLIACSSAAQVLAADTTQDNCVDMRDAVELNMYISGKSSKLVD